MHSYGLIVFYSPFLYNYRQSMLYCYVVHFGVGFTNSFSSYFELLFYDFQSRNVSGSCTAYTNDNYWFYIPSPVGDVLHKCLIFLCPSTN